MELQKHPAGSNLANNRPLSISSATSITAKELIERPVLHVFSISEDRETRFAAKAAITKSLVSCLVSHKVDYTKEDLAVWIEDIYIDCKYDPPELIVQGLGQYRRTVEGFRNWNHVQFIEIMRGKREELARARENAHLATKSAQDDTSIQDVLKGYERQKKEGEERRKERAEKQNDTSQAENVRAQAKKYLENPDEYKPKQK